MPIGGGSPTSLLSTVSLPEFSDLLTREFKMVQGLEDPNDAMQMFLSDPISNNTGDSRLYQEVDTETYAKTKAQGVDAAKAQVGVGYSVTMYLKRVAREIEITYEERTQNKYLQVMGKLTSLTQFVPQRRNLDLTHRLTFGTSTSYTDMDGISNDLKVGDGYQLFYATHALKFSSTTYSNLLSGAPTFSQGAYEAIMTMANTQILSNFGETRVMDFNVIWTGKDVNTVNLVKQFLRSTSDVTQNNPGVINTHQGEMRHIILSKLATTALGAYDSTKRKWWGVAAIGQGEMGWQAIYGESEPANLKVPAKGNNGEDFHNDNWNFGVRGGYGIVVLSGRGILASCPST
jgi:hypothetical protein